MNEWYVVPNIEEFTNKTRAIVYNNFGNWKSEQEVSNEDLTVAQKDIEDLDKILSYQESLVIITGWLKKQKNKKTKRIRYVLDDSIFVNIIKDLNDRLISNIVNSLVQKGIVESAFDSETNDFVFWIKDNDKEKKPKTD